MLRQRIFSPVAYIYSDDVLAFAGHIGGAPVRALESTDLLLNCTIWLLQFVENRQNC
jgi:hypothetical protein